MSGSGSAEAKGFNKVAKVSNAALTFKLLSLLNGVVSLVVLWNLVSFNRTATLRVSIFGGTASPDGVCLTPAHLSPARIPDNYYQSNPLAPSFNSSSAFLHTIINDLSAWRDTGITKDMIDVVSAVHCEGDHFRWTIVDGQLYITHLNSRGPIGWYPNHAEGATSAKGRVPYTILTLLKVLHDYPGQIPDSEGVFGLSDFPCLERKVDSRALPLFGFSWHKDFVDIPMPDYTWWGNEFQWLVDYTGRRPQGWDEQAHLLYNKFANTSLVDRVPKMMWRGRTRDKFYPERDELRREFAGCASALRMQRRYKEASQFDVSGRTFCMADNCDFRFPVYLECMAYTTNLRHKLVCASALLSPRIEFFEWWSRDLVPGVHYVELDVNNLCEDALHKVEAMNARLDSRHLLAEWERQHLEQVAVDPAGWLASVEGRAADNASAMHPWGSRLEPWEIAHAGAEYVRVRASQEQMLLYVRDMLVEYGKLMRYAPEPAKDSICYHGELLLDQFSHPFPADEEYVDREYPWIRHLGHCTVPGRPEDVPTW